jgi:hypothetical protein
MLTPQLPARVSWFAGTTTARGDDQCALAAGLGRRLGSVYGAAAAGDLRESLRHDPMDELC